MILVIFTAFVGMMLAPETIMPINYFYVLLAVTLGAGSSAAINMWFDEDIDRSCLLYTSPSPRDQRGSRMPSSA